MKNTLSLVLAVAFLASFGFAGDQQTGGYRPCDPQVEVCPPPPPPDCTEDCGNGSSMASFGGGDDESSFDLAVATVWSISAGGY